MAEIDNGVFGAVSRALQDAAGADEARDAIAAALSVTYRRLRQHADSYRETDLYRLHQADRHVPGRGVRVAAFDRGYAAGIEAAAADVAKLLGVDEVDLLDTAP